MSGLFSCSLATLELMMKTLKAANPIGIFDSGIGGLTVASAVNKLLPGENIIYFGDTAHLPYGEKSTAAIQAYAVKITDVLLQQGCKLILIACNSASAAAYELVKEYVGSRAKVMNVIDPVVDFVREHYAHKNVGLIGTRQTVSSNVYARKIDALDENIHFTALATPLLVPMIEEGFHKKELSTQIISSYLDDERLQHIDALILGCTHFPLISDLVEAHYNGKVDVLDTAHIVAESLKATLEVHRLVNSQTLGEHRFLVSDFTQSFEKSTSIFFGETVTLEKYPIWD